MRALRLPLLLALAVLATSPAASAESLCPYLGQNQVGACAEVEPATEYLAWSARVAIGDAGGLRAGTGGGLGTGFLGASTCTEAGLAPGGPGAYARVLLSLEQPPWVEFGSRMGCP